MTIFLLILAVALSPLLSFAASLIGGAVGFTVALMFHALKALVRTVGGPFFHPKMTRKA